MSTKELALSFSYNGIEQERLDKVLLKELENVAEWAGYSRSQIKHLIEEKKVVVNGVCEEKAGALVKPGSFIEVKGRDLLYSHIVPFEIDLSILYEDEVILIIDKPHELSMHPGAGRRENTLLNGIIGKLKDTEGERPGIVHRLDKDTTGLVVVAKTQKALLELSKQFAARTVGRAYKALVLLTPRATREVGAQQEGIIETRIGRHPTQRTKMAVLESGGKEAKTSWKRIERLKYGALLDIKLATGRTHQIRVHMAHLLSPIIGDKTYGDFTPLPQKLKKAAEEFGRQALHAYKLEITHPLSAKRLSFESPLPKDFQVLLSTFRNYLE